MDWELAIERHRDALLRILAALLVMAGGSAVDVLPRHLRTAVWRVLRPAEAALRRLLVVVKERMAIAPPCPRAVRPVSTGIARGDGERVPVFALFDARKSFKPRSSWRGPKPQPRIRFFDDVEIFEPVVIAAPDDMVSAVSLCRRLQALQRALADLPKQARRMARWEAKRALVRKETGKYIRPMRPGKPPGHRDHKSHPVDFVLSDCHALALYLLAPPDT